MSQVRLDGGGGAWTVNWRRCLDVELAAVPGRGGLEVLMRCDELEYVYSDSGRGSANVPGTHGGGRDEDRCICLALHCVCVEDIS